MRSYIINAYKTHTELSLAPRDPADVFVNPNDNPFATGASFKIKAASIGANVGDPRWNK